MMDETLEHFKRLLRRNREFKVLFLDEHNEIRPEAMPFFRWLRDFCYVQKARYKVNQGGMIDPNATLITVGRHEVYCQLMGMIDVDDQILIKKIQQIEAGEKNDREHSI